jgi:undecaprenyl-phosphate galactose phosphotransferase
MHQVKPGITGYWQVSGRSDVKFDKRIAMDAYYARKKSILLDILILLKTPWVVLTGKGAA